MKKYIVIDSIARSGTTLLSSIINSQKNCITINGVPTLQEPLMYFNGGWPHDYAQKELLPIESKPINSLNYCIDMIDYNNKRYDTGIDNFEEIIKNTTDIDKFYDTILDKFNCDIIGLRWNQCLFYFNKWVNKTDNHYWLTIIRNPLDRIVSNMQTHEWDLDNAIKNTINYMNIIDTIKDHPQFIYVYYEDLVSNSEKVIKYIYEKLDYKLDSINLENLIGADRKLYKNQGADVMLNKGDHTLGEEYNGIYTTSVNRYEKFLKKKICKLCNTEYFNSNSCNMCDNDEYYEEESHILKSIKKNLKHFDLLKRYF